jgi:PAS domain S-box-containing protein
MRTAMNNPPRLLTEHAYELLIQGVVDYAIYMLDPEGRVVSWNPGAQQIKGYAPQEIIGEHFSRFYTEADRQAGMPQRALEIAAKTGRFTAEAWRVRKNGEPFWAMVVIDAIRSPDGELIGFAKVTRDITERREAQQAMLDSERRFRLLVQGVTDYAIFMLDTEGQITNWNAGAERIKGYSADEIVGQHFSRFYTPEDAASGEPHRALERARTEGRFEAEGWRVRKSGERFWASVVIDAIRNDEGELIGFAKITRDATERRNAQMLLEESREQLFQAQKMEALGQLTGGMAHDFNNLLTAILGASELALRHAGGDEKLKRLLEGVRASAQRGGSLTRQLLAFARRQPLEPKLVDLAQQLPNTAQLLRHSLRPEIELILEIADPLPPIEVDPGQLELALLNFGFNARDAMPDGGALRISAHAVTLHGEIQDLVGDFVALAVSDTGTGIPEEIRNRVFEPFFTTKAFGQGTGLGLSQAYGFAQQSRGALTIDSTVGKGSTVTLYLPSRSSPIKAATGRSTVLVVEDDVFVAELAAEMVREIGFEPQVVASAAEALVTLSKLPGIQLVFSDVIMPGGMNGLELARKIRNRYPELPILLTTGFSEAVSASPGEFPVIPKPYEFDVLAKSMKALIPDDGSSDQK